MNGNAPSAGAVAAENPEPACALDCVAPRRDIELPVHGDRLRLDRIPRDVEAQRDLAKREVAGEERDEPELGRRQQPRPRPVFGAPGIEIASQAPRALGDDPEAGLLDEDLVDLVAQLSCAGGVRETELQARELEAGR